MADRPDHFCPGCGTPQKSFPRYPWYFCKACLATATDGAGRALAFANVSLSGGFMWRPEGEGEDGWTTCRAIIALISGRPVMIGEARFGGIVAEPLPDHPLALEGVIDLRHGDA